MVPSEVTTVMWFLSMDELLAVTHTYLRPATIKYLAVLDPYSHKLCLFTEKISKSMARACEFLKACRVKVQRSVCLQACIHVNSIMNGSFQSHLTGFI